MDLQRAKTLLKILSDGINPTTGELLPPSDSANQAEIVRALYTVLNVLDSEENELFRNSSNYTGRPWTREDEIKLCQLYDANSSPNDICNCLNRSQEAVAAKLVKLGKINHRQEFRKKMQ